MDCYQAIIYNYTMNITFIIDTLGWVGTILYLVAYALVFMKKVEGDSVVHQGMNIAWSVTGMLTLGRRWLTRS
jgi:hypothetical protein